MCSLVVGIIGHEESSGFGIMRIEGFDNLGSLLISWRTGALGLNYFRARSGAHVHALKCQHLPLDVDPMYLPCGEAERP